MTAPPVRVRLAEPADALAVAEVHVRSWQGGYRGIVPDDVLEELSVAEREATWADVLSGRGAEVRTFVAEDGEGIAGFVSVDVRAREIPALYVAPRAWRQGVGAALVRAALACLRDAGSGEATLWVLADNARARTFYARFGFRPDGRTQPSPRLGLREVRLLARVPRD